MAQKNTGLIYLEVEAWHHARAWFSSQNYRNESIYWDVSDRSAVLRYLVIDINCLYLFT